MGLNRLSRDMILSRALDMIDSPALDQKDRPGGVVSQNALSVGWLQDGIDYFHRKYPFGAQIVFSAWTLALGANTSTVPTDYLLDLRNAITITAPVAYKKRLLKTDIQRIRSNLTLSQTGCPSFYTILGTTIYYERSADQAYTGTFAYYKLPTVLEANTIPPFPDDFTLIEYVRLRGQEWTQQASQGSAMAYASTIIAGLRAAGLGQEGESTDFPLDPSIFRPSGAQTIGSSEWLGDSIPR